MMIARIEINGTVYNVQLTQEGTFKDDNYHLLNSEYKHIHDEFESIVFDAIADGLTAGDTLEGKSYDDYIYTIIFK